MFKNVLKGIVLATLIASLLLVACSPAATQEPNSEPATSEPVTIEYWTFVEYANAQATIDAVAAFEAANPGITVDVVGKPDTEITAGVIVGASSGELPDVFTIAFNTGQEMLKAGALKDIAQEWDALPDDYKNQFAPGAVNGLNQDGKVYGIPYTAYATVMYRNLTVLRNAGIDPALGIKDWADWLDQMEKVKAAGFAALPNYTVDGWLVMHFLGGVDGVNSDVVDGKTTITEAQLTEAYQFLKDIAPFGTKVGPFDAAASDLFISDQLAFYGMGPWADTTFAAAKITNPAFDYDYVLMPGEKEGYTAGVHGGEFLAITPGDNSDAAFKFAVFMANQEQVTKLSAEFGGRATYNNAAMADPALAKYTLLALTVEAASMGMADAAYFKPFPLSVRQPLADYAASAVAGEMTPEEAARAAIAAINDEISKAQ